MHRVSGKAARLDSAPVRALVVCHVLDYSLSSDQKQYILFILYHLHYNTISRRRALHIIIHKGSMYDVKRKQNLLACLMLVGGDEGVDIDIREECGCEMEDGFKKSRVFRRIFGGSTHAIDYETEKACEKRVVASPASSSLGWLVVCG
jgi:hypothetical protein